MASKYQCLLLLVSFVNCATTEKLKYLQTTSVQSLVYNVSLNFDETDDDDFQLATGRVLIQFHNADFTNLIILNQKDLNITGVRIFNPQNPTLTHTPEVTTNPELETMNLSLNPRQPLILGQAYILYINYTLDLKLYKDKFFVRRDQDDDDRYRFFLATRFEPTGARAVFPCFDEPSFRSTYHFYVQFIRYTSRMSPTRNVALSFVGSGIESGSVDSPPPDPRYMRFFFRTTQWLPAHTLCFVITNYTGDYSVLGKSEVRYRLWTRRVTSDNSSFSWNLVPKIISELENLTGTRVEDLQLSDIHIFAIPHFNYSVQVSAGIIIGSEYDLLADEKESSLEHKQRVGLKLASSLSQLFLHRILARYWWSEFYLMKGLSLYLAYHIMGKIFPTLEMEKQFAIQELQPVLLYETPLATNFATPQEIPKKVARPLWWRKGAVLFRMVANLMTVEYFMHGFRFWYQNPELHVWTCIQESLIENLKKKRIILEKFVNGWVNEPGCPLVKVSLAEKEINFELYRFYSSFARVPIWHVPLSLVAVCHNDPSKQERYLEIMQRTKTSVTLPDSFLRETYELPDIPEVWAIVNYQQLAPYRVSYAPNLLARLDQALSEVGFSDIPELNRAQLIDDFFNFAYTKTITFDEFLSLSKFLKYETSYHVWKSAIRVFSKYFELVLLPENAENLKEYIFKLSQRFYNTISFDEAKDYDYLYTLKRTMLMEFYCKLGQKECVRKADADMERYRYEDIKPENNLRYAIYCTSVSKSDQHFTNYRFMEKLYAEEKIHEERYTLVRGLACSHSRYIQSVLKNMTKPHVPKEEAMLAMFGVYESSWSGVSTVLEFYQNNNDTIADYFNTTNYLEAFLNGLFRRVKTDNDFRKLKMLMDDQRFPVNPDISLEVFGRMNASSVVNEEMEKFNWTSIDDY